MVFSSMLKLKVIVLVFLLEYAQAQDANCDFRQSVAIGRTYYIYSPGYPNNYTAGVQCRWIATCPAGFHCRLDCNDINIPSSPSCSLDRLLISKTGDPQLTGAQYYCGRGSLTATSTNQTIVVGLVTSQRSPGGRFVCTLTAQPATPSTTCSCGYKKRNRIVGGQATSPNEYPMMAGLVFPGQGIRCGAVIIANSYVLTAAHCVSGRSVSQMAVVVGIYNTSSTGGSAQAFRVMSYTVHPLYSQATFDYDIAIVTVAGRITFNDFVGPVCLPFKFVNTNLTNKLVTLLGWGLLSFGGEKSDVLREVDVNVISQATCRNQVSTLTARQFCTFAPGKDACQDDSGGPVLYTEPATGLLFDFGIISSGRACAANDPGINTNVIALLDWIVTNAPADYCIK